MPALSDIQRKVGYQFRNEELLERALTHKSYANENRVTAHNERLEFLGDAVLSLVISEYLMQTCQDSSEGDLSRLRAAVVSEPALASIAREIGLGKYLLLGRGENQTGGRDKDSLLANCLEALIASIYLDAGKAAIETFVIRFFKELIEKTCMSRSPLDYKTTVQELCQERLKQLPEYHIVAETGPNHRKQFIVELVIKGETYGRGAGKSKKEAEQRAAKDAIGKLDRKNSRQ